MTKEDKATKKDKTIKNETSTKPPKTQSSDEIDMLFTKRPAVIKAAAPTVVRPKDDIGDTRGTKNRARPLTDDGLPIFTAEEMGIGTGGDTADCPFDCECCY
jgi:hypothetical protein